MQRMLAEWESHGIQEICIEFRTILTLLELVHLPPKRGGQIVDSGITSHRLDIPLSERPDSTWTRATGTNQIPLFILVQTLSPPESEFVDTEAQRNQRSNLSFSPKITTFNGLSPLVSDVRTRPFVTSFRSTASGLLPSITNVNEGREINVFAFAGPDNVTLRLHFRQSIIQDLTLKNLVLPSHKHRIQVPKVREVLLQSTAQLNSADTLLVSHWSVIPRDT